MRIFQNWINAHQDILALIVVCFIVFVVYMANKQRRKISFLGIIVYTIFILYKTVFSRKQGYYPANLELGWSYKAWINGMLGMFSQIYLNIMLFIPIGVFSGILFLNKNKRSCILPVAFGGILTVIVECSQLIFHCGTFELDDILNNTIGTTIGMMIVLAINRCRGVGNERT